MDNHSGSKSALEIPIPVLEIHDKNEPGIPVTAGIKIYNHLKKENCF